MSILNTPFAMPLMNGIQEMSTLFFDVVVHETIEPSAFITDVITATNFGTVSNGKGIINTVKTSLVPISQRTKTPTAADYLNPTEPSVAQEAILIDTYEYAKVSTEEFYTAESFKSGQEVNAFLAYIQRTAQDSLTFDMFDNKVMPLFEADLWSNKKVVTNFDTSSPTTLTEKNQQLEYNAKMFAQFIFNRSTVYQLKNTDLTDVAGVVTALPREQIRLYIDSAFKNYVEVALSGIYNQENIRKVFNVNEICILPNPDGAFDVANPIAFLCDKRKVAHCTGYTTSISDRNYLSLYTHMAVHRSCGVGKFAYLAGEAIYLKTPAVKSVQKAKKEKNHEIVIIDGEKTAVANSTIGE